MRALIIVFVVLLAQVASAKINPTITARTCLTRAIDADKDAAGCFTEAGWSKVGKDFVKQQKRKGWTLHAGDESGCCTEKVLWAEVFLKKGSKTVDRLWLILKKVDGTLKIDSMTEDNPSGR